MRRRRAGEFAERVTIGSSRACAEYARPILNTLLQHACGIMNMLLLGSCDNRTMTASGSQVCFRSDAGTLDPNHGFDNFARASLTIVAVFFQKSWSLLMAETQEIAPGVWRGEWGGKVKGIVYLHLCRCISFNNSCRYLHRACTCACARPAEYVPASCLFAGT